MSRLVYGIGEKHCRLTNLQGAVIKRLGVELFRALEKVRALMLDQNVKASARAGEMDRAASEAVQLVSNRLATDNGALMQEVLNMRALESVLVADACRAAAWEANAPQGMYVMVRGPKEGEHVAMYELVLRAFGHDVPPIPQHIKDMAQDFTSAAPPAGGDEAGPLEYRGSGPDRLPRA